jgi:hypothetical protein
MSLSHTKMPITLLLIRYMGCMGTTRDLFCQTCYKNAVKSTIVLWIMARE